jgi:hypothetical protein
VSRLAQPVLDSPPLVRYGLPELIEAASPAAGADFTATVDGNYFVRLVSVFCRIVCSADAASREVVVEYQTAEGNRFALTGAATTITAGLTGDYFFSSSLGEDIFTVDSSVLAPLPPMLLAPTQKFLIHVVAMDNTDQLSRIRYVWERFYTTNQPPSGGPLSVL